MISDSEGLRSGRSSTSNSPLTPALCTSGEAGEVFHVESQALFMIPPDELVALPDGARRDAQLRMKMLAEIHRAPKARKTATIARLSAGQGGRRGFSEKRLWALYYEYLETADWRCVVDKARAPGLVADSMEGELRPARRHDFLEWAHGFLLLNQREKFQPRHRKLMERLELWRRTGRKEYAIPGYDSAPPNAPGSECPAGWTASNLRRLVGASKFEKRAMGVGRAAAAEFRPLVLTSRARSRIGQILFFDDNEHDMKVRMLGSQGRVLRPLEFSCLDYFSGCFVANVFKPTLYDEENEKRIKLRAVEFIWLAVHWLLDIGWRADTGTILTAEHGTAKFPEWFQAAVTELTKGKVRFEEGAVDRRAACEGFYKGAARGNFRVKSPLESMFNLVRNETSDLLLFPGQVGKDRNHSPEELMARESHEKQLALAELAMGGEAVALLRHDFLEWNQWKRMAFEVYAKINRRGGPGLEWWGHALEGYVEAGLIANEWRLPLSNQPTDAVERVPTFSDWFDATALEALNGKGEAIRALLASDPVNLTRSRKLSPWEVWQRGRAELTRAPMWWLPLILPPDMARPVTVLDDHTIEFSDQTICPDKLRFVARCTDSHGRETGRGAARMLRPGSTYLGYVNQFNPLSPIFLCDPNGQAVGECPAWPRVDRGDEAAVAEQNREARRHEAALLAPVAKAGAELARVRADNAAWNAERLQAYGNGPATEPEKRIRKEQENLAAAAAAIFGNNQRTEG